MIRSYLTEKVFAAGVPSTERDLQWFKEQVSAGGPLHEAMFGGLGEVGGREGYRTSRADSALRLLELLVRYHSATWIHSIRQQVLPEHRSAGCRIYFFAAMLAEIAEKRGGEKVNPPLVNEDGQPRSVQSKSKIKADGVPDWKVIAIHSDAEDSLKAFPKAVQQDYLIDPVSAEQIDQMCEGKRVGWAQRVENDKLWGSGIGEHGAFASGEGELKITGMNPWGWYGAGYLSRIGRTPFLVLLPTSPAMMNRMSRKAMLGIYPQLCGSLNLKKIMLGSVAHNPTVVDRVRTCVRSCVVSDRSFFQVCKSAAVCRVTGSVETGPEYRRRSVRGRRRPQEN